MSRHGAMRASDADRDQIVDRLHRAATEGRIASEELEHRVSIALKAKTYSELEATVADLPGLRSRPGTGLERRSVGGWAVSTVRANPMLLVLVIPALAVTAAVVVTITVLWGVFALLAMMFGGRRHHRPPWIHAARGGVGPLSGPLGPWGAGGPSRR